MGSVMEVVEADRKISQNDWSRDPENPAVQHREIVAALDPAPEPTVRVPTDIRKMIREFSMSDLPLLVWFRSLGTSAIEIEDQILKLADKTVTRACMD